MDDLNRRRTEAASRPSFPPPRDRLLLVSRQEVAEEGVGTRELLGRSVLNLAGPTLLFFFPPALLERGTKEKGLPKDFRQGSALPLETTR